MSNIYKECEIWLSKEDIETKSLGDVLYAKFNQEPDLTARVNQVFVQLKDRTTEYEVPLAIGLSTPLSTFGISRIILKYHSGIPMNVFKDVLFAWTVSCYNYPQFALLHLCK